MGQRNHPISPRCKTGSRSSSPPPSPIWPTGPTAATSSPARLTSPTPRGSRSPPRPPPAPSATTSASMRRRAAGISTLHGPSPVTRSRRLPANCAPIRSSPSTSTTGTSPAASSTRAGTRSQTGDGARQAGGIPASTRDGHLREAISALTGLAREHRCRAIVIEDVDFAANREQGREHQGTARTAEGAEVLPPPRRRTPDREVPRAAHPDGNQSGLFVVAVDPAYTSKWGAQHWLAPRSRPHRRRTATTRPPSSSAGAGSDTGHGDGKGVTQPDQRTGKRELPTPPCTASRRPPGNRWTRRPESGRTRGGRPDRPNGTPPGTRAAKTVRAARK